MTHVRLNRFRLSLDANVLVSAAWKEGSKVGRIWRIPNVELITSNYVVVECQRNLPLGEQQDRLTRFLQSVRVLEFQAAPQLENSPRSEEHTSELQSLRHLVCRLLLEK